jgi:hypothetical protein
MNNDYFTIYNLDELQKLYDEAIDDVTFWQKRVEYYYNQLKKGQISKRISYLILDNYQNACKQLGLCLEDLESIKTTIDVKKSEVF